MFRKLCAIYLYSEDAKKDIMTGNKLNEHLYFIKLTELKELVKKMNWNEYPKQYPWTKKKKKNSEINDS